MKNMKGTFSSFDPNSNIFKEIIKQKPLWWTLFCNDKELYIEIRKDNYINVYYYGGCLAKIEYSTDFKAEIHQKYLGDNTPRGKTKKGHDKFYNDPLDLKTLNENKISEIKKLIKKEYLEKINDEKPAEKWMQGKMIKGNPNYIDSEFQFNKDPEIGFLRIDLVELKDNKLSFIELKGISDNRLRNDKIRNPKEPEIIEQMEKYNLFINKYQDSIIEYYQKLIDLKNKLGLSNIIINKITLNNTPKLIIVDTYCKMTKGREERIKDIETVLKVNEINFEIVKCTSPSTEA